jgi:hypothetical protein
MANDQYTLTVYFAAPLSGKADGGLSPFGHMWYSVSDGVQSNDFGFFPQKTAGSDSPTVSGPGVVSSNASANGVDENLDYPKPDFITVNISYDQYNNLKSFGLSPDNGFAGTNYNANPLTGTHDCVDFTWAALNSAGIQPVAATFLGPHGTPIPLTPSSSLIPEDNELEVQAALTGCGKKRRDSRNFPAAA